MHPLDRVVAGLSCREVLERLGDHVDGDLSAADVARLRGHLAGCDTCERFGGRIGALVSRLRVLEVEEAVVPADASERLRVRLEQSRK